MIIQPTFLWEKFSGGIASALTALPLPYSYYPFSSVGKSLSDDWKNVGGDMYAAIKKFNQSNES